LLELEVEGLSGKLGLLAEKFAKFYDYFNSKTEEEASLNADFDYIDFLVSQYDVSVGFFIFCSFLLNFIKEQDP
jgi:hypothetical protein